MEINRADMKLLTECGYSGVLRNIDVRLTPIFEALDTWMPDQSAGPIGLALEAMVAGDIRRADEILSGLLNSKRKGRAEAKAILAMCKALQNDRASAEGLADDLKGQGGNAEDFTRLLTDRDAEAVVQAREVAAE